LTSPNLWDTIINMKKPEKAQGRGRPTLNGHRGGESPMLRVRLTEAAFAELRRRAEREGVTVSELVRRAVEGLTGKGR
jgi:hypothetical protein